jgi:hypothetical protein
MPPRSGFRSSPAEKRLPEAVRAVVRQRRGHIHVVARHPDVGVAEQLLNDRQGDALVYRDGGGRVSHRMHAMVPQAGRLQDVRPLLPVGAGIERPAVLLAPDEVVIFPDVRGGQPLTGLGSPVLLQHRDELRRGGTVLRRRGAITSQLPSITDLTARTGLAVGTVRRAIDILVKEGLVQTVPGRGTFVMR